VSQSRVRQAVDAFARGEIVVVTDDDDRENEGDLILAAVHTTAEKMAFIIRHTCGIVTAPLTGEIARRLHLAPMVADSDAIHGTAFTVSADYRHGTTSGISAEDRTVMRGAQVAEFAKQHRLKRMSVADLIAYRQAREKLVTRVAEFTVASEIGDLSGYAYVTPFDKVHHYAFVYGNIGDGRDVPTRLHRASILEDVFGGAKPIHAALSRFKAAGHGVLVYLRDGTSGVPTSTVGEGATGAERERSEQWREIGLGAQILRDLRISSIQVLATRSRTYVGLAGFGIEIIATEPLEGD